VVFNSQSSLGMEQRESSSKEFQRGFPDLPARRVAPNARQRQVCCGQIASAEKITYGHDSHEAHANASFEGNLISFCPSSSPSQFGLLPTRSKAQQTFLDNLKKIRDVLTAALRTRPPEDKPQSDAADGSSSAREDRALYKEMVSSLAKVAT